MAIQERRQGLARQTAAIIASIESDGSAVDRAVAADVLLRHIFIPPAQPLDNIEYAAIYRFAEQHSGGDIIDVYHCMKGVCFSLTDISGKGVGAALHAGLVKYGIRAYANEGHAPRTVLRQLNRFYCENDVFEGAESFASVFLARYESKERLFSYASAGHEGLIFFPRGGIGMVLHTTGPVVGILEDRDDLYFDDTLTVDPGAIFVAVSDGITEARNERALFEMEGLLEVATRYRHHSMADMACSIARSARAFARNRVIDDMAVLAVRFN